MFSTKPPKKLAPFCRGVVAATKKKDRSRQLPCRENGFFFWGIFFVRAPGTKTEDHNRPNLAVVVKTDLVDPMLVGIGLFSPPTFRIPILVVESDVLWGITDLDIDPWPYGHVFKGDPLKVGGFPAGFPFDGSLAVWFLSFKGR